MRIKNKLLLFTLLSVSTLASANDEPTTTNVSELFPIAAQSHNNNGIFDSQWGSKVIGSRNHTIDFKRHDNLNGLCDNVTCKINNTLAPSFTLESFDGGKKIEKSAYYLSKPSNIPVSNISVGCDYNNNKKSTFTANSYKKITVTNECTIAALSNEVIVSEVISVTGDATLYLKPGSYWLDTLELAGSGKIKSLPNQAGAINLYVKDQVNLTSRTQLGTLSNPVNIIYDGELQITNTEVTGMIRADSLSLKGGSAKLNLMSGEYWYKNINMSGSGQLTLYDTALTTLHIKDQIEIQGGDTIINKNNKPLLIYIYNGNGASLHIKGSAVLYGHTYTLGGVELNEGHIVGAVNVHSLFMKGGSITYSPLSGIPGAKLDHYRLHFNTNTDNVTAYACGDGTCSPSTLYTGEVKKLHIHADNPNFHNFDKFYGSSSITKKWNTSQCTTFTIQNADKNQNGADPWPESKPVLQCFVDGTRVDNCKVCPKAEPVSSYGYVYGSATIPSVSSSSTNEFTVKEGGGNSLAIYDSKFAIDNGSKIKLPLEVTFDKADKVDLVLTDTDGREFPVSVTFVPKSLGWVAQSAENGCGESNSKFNYVANSESCKAIGVAGSSVNLVLEARGEGGKKIDSYQANLGDKALQVNELNEKYVSQLEAKFPMDFSSNNAAKAKLNYSISQVALIKAQVKSHYAPYIKDTNAAGVKVTNGDTLVIGRTVPASLLVKEIENGKIADSVVYAAQPDDIKFSTIPSFIIQGLDTNKKPLPSYTGEFAGGLIGNSEIKLDSKLSDSALTLRHSEPNNDGSHKLKLDAASLKFIKDQPFSETSLALPLDLTINDHDQTTGITGTTKLAAKEDTLRYGFVRIDDLELPVDVSGDMPLRLNYFGDNITSVKQGSKALGLSASSIKLNTAPVADPKIALMLDSKAIKVGAYKTPWQGKVEMEVPAWLQPYDKKINKLVNPSATLNIVDDARKRGNDRIFNRREVVR